MQEILLNFINSLVLQDYIIIWVSVFFSVFFVFLWLEKLFKSYLWIILWLFIFSATNLTLFGTNDNEIWFSSFRAFFVEHRIIIAYLTIFSIPLLAFLMTFNSWIFFRIWDKKGSNYFMSFIFGLLYFTFVLSILVSIINNRFLFSINDVLLDEIKWSFLVSIIDFFDNSNLFSYIKKYDYLINFIIIFYIFYKMTIWWIVDFLLWAIFSWIKNNMKPKQKEEKA